MAKQKTKQQKSQKAKVQRTQDLPQQTKCEEKFAEGLCFKKLFFVFLVGSVIGTIYEELLYGVQTWYATGSWEWTVRRGVIYGPFNVIYGFGAVVMVYLLLRKKYTNWQIFLYASLLGGIVEYVVSLLQEVFTHTTSWDYSNYFLNINGRTTVPFMVVWGDFRIGFSENCLSFCLGSSGENSGEDREYNLRSASGIYGFRYADFMDGNYSTNFTAQSYRAIYADWRIL